MKQEEYVYEIENLKNSRKGTIRLLFNLSICVYDNSNMPLLISRAKLSNDLTYEQKKTLSELGIRIRRRI